MCNCVRNSCKGVPLDLNDELLKQITNITVNSDNTITLTLSDSEGNTINITSSEAVDVSNAIKALNRIYDNSGNALLSESALENIGDQLIIEAEGEVLSNDNPITCTISNTEALSMSMPDESIHGAKVRFELTFIKVSSDDDYILSGKAYFTNAEDNSVIDIKLIREEGVFTINPAFSVEFDQVGGTFDYINVNNIKR